MIQIKRAYAMPLKTDGSRILVDRLWPRGMTKENLAIDQWLKEISPSDDLRRWFAHKEEHWSEFLCRYFKELDQKQTFWQPIIEKSKQGCVTLIYASRDTQYNNARALKQYLDSKQES